MKLLLIAFAFIIFLMSTPAFAQSWSGYLVDSRCYDSEERSVNPFDDWPPFIRDKDLEVQLCTPSAKTKSFAVVAQNGSTSFKLDPTGNEIARALVRKTGKKAFRKVTVTGEMSKNIVKVDSILAAKQDVNSDRDR